MAPAGPPSSPAKQGLASWAVHRLGQRAQAGAPPVPIPQGQPARRKAESVWPLLSVPAFFLRRSDTVGNVPPETATERSILEIASRSRQSQRQQHVSQPARYGEVERTRQVRAHTETAYIETRAGARMWRDAVLELRCSTAAAGAPAVPLSPGQPARRGGGCRATS